MNVSIDACGAQQMHLSHDNGTYHNSMANGHSSVYSAYKSRHRCYFPYSIWLCIGKCFENSEMMYAATVPCIMCGMYFVRYESRPSTVCIRLIDVHFGVCFFPFVDLHKWLDVFDSISHTRFPIDRTTGLWICLFNGFGQFLLHDFAVNLIHLAIYAGMMAKCNSRFKDVALDIEEGENVHRFDCVPIFCQSFCVFVGGAIRLCVQYESECYDWNNDGHRLDWMVCDAAETQTICMENSSVSNTRWHFTIAGAKRFSAIILGTRCTLIVASIDNFTDDAIV